jgi:hypothetical protein
MSAEEEIYTETSEGGYKSIGASRRQSLPTAVMELDSFDPKQPLMDGYANFRRQKETKSWWTSLPAKILLGLVVLILSFTLFQTIRHKKHHLPRTSSFPHPIQLTSVPRIPQPKHRLSPPKILPLIRLRACQDSLRTLQRPSFRHRQRDA